VGSLQRSPRPLAGFEGPTSKAGDERGWEGGEGSGGQRRGEGEGRGEEAFLVMWPRRLSSLNPSLTATVEQMVLTK